MRSITIIAIVLVLAVLGGCRRGENAASGAAPGASGNPVSSGQNRAIATAVGSVVGGISGHQIGRGLDEADRRAAMAAEYRALEYGKAGAATPWRNPSNGNHGSVVVQSPYVSGNQHCRGYSHTVYIGGQPQTMNGKACRRPDGTWGNVG
jgi:surface antigen